MKIDLLRNILKSANIFQPALILPDLLVLGLGRTFLATGNGRQKALRRRRRPHTTAETRTRSTPPLPLLWAEGRKRRLHFGT